MTLSVACLMLLMHSTSANAQTLQFSGYTWQVRNGNGGPGPNNWDGKCVWLDKQGHLHLKIQKIDGVWTCAEIQTNKSLGFGTYTFKVEGPLDRLDKNIVLGLFNYPDPGQGVDGTNEIDIEDAHWGMQKYPPMNLTVWPAVLGVKDGHTESTFKLPSDKADLSFDWSANTVTYSCIAEPSGKSFASWTYSPSNPVKSIPQHPLPVHINLWLFHGHHPSNHKSVEMVVDSFEFTPAVNAESTTTQNSPPLESKGK